jgi:hypothetical protein
MRLVIAIILGLTITNMLIFTVLWPYIRKAVWALIDIIDKPAAPSEHTKDVFFDRDFVRKRAESQEAETHEEKATMAGVG